VDPPCCFDTYAEISKKSTSFAQESNRFKNIKFMIVRLSSANLAAWSDTTSEKLSDFFKSCIFSKVFHL
jgi:hypothetical protein